MRIMGGLDRGPQHQIVGEVLFVVAHRTTHDFVEIAFQAAGVGRVIVQQVRPPVHQRIGDQRGLRRPAAVDRRLPDTGSRGDVVHVGVDVAVLGQRRQALR